jgi:hypothetical protein
MSQKAPIRSRLLARAALACVLGLGLCAGAAGPASAEDDDPPIDVKVMRKVMRGLGLKRGDEANIEYRERSPLVVPPTLALPPPEDATAVERNPAWPNDPDIRGRREAAKRQQKAIDWEQDARALTPAELNRGIPRGGPAPQAAAPSVEESQNQMRPSQLGFTGFGNLRSMFGFDPKPETSSFEREPTRTDLTQPPPGYLTPSPAQPYGVGKNQSGYGDIKPADPMDAPVGGAGQR